MSSISIKPQHRSTNSDQPLDHRRHRRRADIHGDLGHDDRERGPAIYFRRPVRRADGFRLGHHQLPGCQRHCPADYWLAVGRLGRRNYFLLCIAVFTLASAMCGFATSLGQMIVFRIIQGLAGGGLQPCSQGVLLDAFPEEKQGTAMTLFGVAAILGPIVGPTLGGWLCVNYDWRYIFLINVPIGVFSLIAAYLVVEDPEYLKRERAELSRLPLNFDYIGL